MKARMFTIGKGAAAFVLTAMLIFSVLVPDITAVGAEAEDSGTAVIYFYNSSDWDVPYIYSWTGDGKTAVQLSGGWPGSAMTQITGKVWSFELDTQAENIIFSDNGSEQTVDILLDGDWTTSSYIYYLSDMSGENYTVVKEKDYVPQSGAYTLTAASSNGSVCFINSNDLTLNTANEGDIITVVATPDSGYALSNISSDAGTLEQGGDEYTYTLKMPASDITVTAEFEFDKALYVKSQEDALWLDADPDNEVNSSATLIRWNNYYGSNHDTSVNPYTFYVPSDVDLGAAKIYNGYSDDVTLNGTKISAGGSQTVNLAANTDYTLSGAVTETVKVMQGSTDSMFISQSSSLPTQVNNSLSNKNSVKITGGICVTSDNGVLSSYSLKQIKGRGNSFWEASYQICGKYAFNMKLNSKAGLYGMSASKNWCLLANNVDEAMMRNALTYDLAAELGLNSPEYTFVDIYDNGEYMGAYLVTSKVDVGKNDLVKGTNIDDINEEAAGSAYTDSESAYENGSYTYNGSEYSCKWVNVCGDSSTTADTITESDFTSGTFLLEFEINTSTSKRYDEEASGFVSPQGQTIVVKSPEFATEAEVKYIAQLFAETEALAYADSSDTYLTNLSQYMDLESFAKMYLIQELSANLDSAATSYYLTYNCSDGSSARFVASPVWDYDWAWGQCDGTKPSVYDYYGSLNPSDAASWFARYKSQNDESDKYSLQSTLANNSAFMSVIKKVWTESGGVYDTVQAYYGEDSIIDKWAEYIEASVEMNETRWGFIASDPLGTPPNDWSSNNTGDTFAEAVYYLETTWTQTRTEWMESQINTNDYSDYTQNETVTIHFKSLSDSDYLPSIKLNDLTYAQMEQGQILGTANSEAREYCWYDYEIDISDFSEIYIISFKAANTGLSASAEITFTEGTTDYYFSADDLTESGALVDLTGKAEYIRNYFCSPQNMVYPADNRVGYTNIDGTAWQMGAYLDYTSGSPTASPLSVRSATLAQKTAVGSESVTELQRQLMDVNLDGTVNVSDATQIQKAVVIS
ncbi:MAG: CotH kinase family protein [Clostridiales bacterium]|nr:CotH kinase family protein [Clostridiales bacterium]